MLKFMLYMCDICACVLYVCYMCVYVCVSMCVCLINRINIHDAAHEAEDSTTLDALFVQLIMKLWRFLVNLELHKDVYPYYIHMHIYKHIYPI